MKSLFSAKMGKNPHLKGEIMIDWKRKLTSRKFWTAVASFISMMIIFFGGAESTATQVTALIMAGASVIGYVIGEGLADAGGDR